MPVLKTLVDDPLKAAFRSLAQARGMSESEFLRAVVLAVTETDTPAEAARPAEEKDIALSRMTVRLPGFVMDGVNVHARARGMAPSRWVASLVQSNVYSGPVLTELELSELRASLRELAAVGRNLNQIARALNESPHQTERIKLQHMDELTTRIEALKASIRSMVHASRRSWGVTE